MATHQIEVVIPEDHRLLIDVPKTIRSGPATLILVTPSESPVETEELTESDRSEARARWQAMRAELARDPRPFRQLSPRRAQRTAATAARNRPGPPLLERRIRTP